MTIEFRTVSVVIPTGTKRRTIPGSATFSSPVAKATVAMNGFKLDYASKDHHITIIEADTDFVSIVGSTVNFRVECDYADKNADDPYSGYITTLIIAELQ